MTKEDKRIYQREYYKRNKDRIKERNLKLVIEKYGSFAVKNRVLRHKRGESKVYYDRHGLSYTKEYKVAAYHKRRALEKSAGKLTAKIVQMVYEDNIKKFGTLTCYLCFCPIKFGKDSLEHKTPLSRGGSNYYDNLAVACIKCNQKKSRLTELEYRNKVRKQ